MAVSVGRSGPSDGLGGRSRQLLAGIARSPAAWAFALAWLGSAAVLTASGQGFPFFGLVIAAVYLPLSLVTVLVTEPAPADPAARDRVDRGGAAVVARRRLVAQLAVAALFVGLTGWGGLAFHGVVADGGIPLWSGLMDTLHGWGGRWLGHDNFVANPVTYVVLPLAALLLLGAGPVSMGLGRGHRVGRVLLVWCALPLAYFAFVLVTGRLGAGRLLGRLVSNALQNGPMEEFLFRGVVQTRLRAVAGPGWALVLQALLFGAWHLGLGFSNTGHAGVWPALATVIVHQALIGLALGVIFDRTRNLVAPSIVHVVINSLG